MIYRVISTCIKLLIGGNLLKFPLLFWVIIPTAYEIIFSDTLILTNKNLSYPILYSYSSMDTTC